MAWRLSVQFGDVVISHDFVSQNAAANKLVQIEADGYVLTEGGVTVKYYPSSIMQAKLYQVEEPV